VKNAPQKISLPVLIAFAITMKKTVAISLRVNVSAAGAWMVTVPRFLVIVRTFRIVSLSPPGIVCSSVETVAITLIVGA
jgi:hypothetical protein